MKSIVLALGLLASAAACDADAQAVYFGGPACRGPAAPGFAVRYTGPAVQVVYASPGFCRPFAPPPARIPYCRTWTPPICTYPTVAINPGYWTGPRSARSVTGLSSAPAIVPNPVVFGRSISEGSGDAWRGR